MKRVGILMFIFLSAVLVSSVSATPIYYGDTYADYGVGGNPGLPTGSGYYIWSNDPSRTSWSVRWTGNNDNDPVNYLYNWYGSIEIGTGLNLESTDSVLFETGQDSIELIDSSYFGDVITYDGYAGNHWDGFDFTISGEVGNVIGFNLGSTLWDGDFTAGTQTYTGTGVFLGQAGTNPDVMYQNVLDGNQNIIGVGQNFEVPAPVPEPATMLLMGIGLAGFAIVNRRRFRKNA
ncbi:MAG: PEP-CTERM sorting domain-containing protein [Thermodesulfobacteriota bacterium]|nr:PEP-CTERM sorting domain-containing protein [Thermodesulfobacteriota bacterium]